ncbi:Single-strand selective monofunctional uracil DNA glycosylase [Frankliniella fusca]|uniref:Single-strand selective monofunctional uracil DNA glycosylase n=1 Tax=Frankliniella fusca TaxID=407009 RepID=A0AAE1HJ22_9NEOP|nr:Single-strand selective monofunctional uracil DNA glycosylase [Frankliniella fusca]KAK3922274.1 Single-strand selective monofunctional uracil DNA glycosylase [Frankliniella fusca]
MSDGLGGACPNGSRPVGNVSAETSSLHAERTSPSSSCKIKFPPPSTINPPISEQLLRIELELCTQLSAFKFSHPVEYVYSPINYAFNLHAQFVRMFAQTAKKVLFLGMNPGPWGMSQTGIPFGEVSVVRDWFAINGCVSKPAKEHPARSVQGLDCPRSEVSGKRFWGLFQELCGSSPYIFFQNCFIYNHCPISLLSVSGKNITPAELKASEFKALLAACDAALIKVLLLLQVETIVAIGRFAEKRANIAVQDSNLKSIKVVSIPHPSPRNASCNGNWREVAIRALENLNLIGLFTLPS